MTKPRKYLMVGIVLTAVGCSMVFASDLVRFVGIFVLVTGLTFGLAAWLQSKGIGGGV